MAKRRDKQRPIGSIIAITAACLTGIALASFVYGKTIATTIHPAVHVGSVALGGLTPSQAQSQLQQAVATYEQSSISLTVRGVTVHPKAFELGLSFDTAATIKQAYLVGRNNKLEATFGVPALGRTIAVPLVASLDQQQFKQYLETLNNWFAAPVQQPRFTLTNEGTSVVAGLSGVGVAIKDFSTVFLTNASSLTPTAISLDLKKQEPIATPEQMTQLLPEATSVANKKIVLTLNSFRYQPTAAEITSWLIPTLGETGLSLGLDEAAISNYLAAADQKIRREPKPTFGYIAEHDGVYAYKNSEGMEVDVDATMRLLAEKLFTDPEVNITIATKTIKPPIEYAEVTSPVEEGKVISVDITKQALFAFDDGKLVFWTRVSTGINDWTPTGRWKIYAKTPIQVMSGPGYYLPGVKWVMPYNGDYTLHTAYWHHDFGIPKSHGCTNMYEEDAKWLYDWATVGTPVVIYKS